MVPDDDQMTNPTDVSYIYKGYAPITIRLVEQALKDGWGPVSDILPMLPGAQFDSLQVQEPNGQVVDKQVKPGGNSATAQGGVNTVCNSEAEQLAVWSAAFVASDDC